MKKYSINVVWENEEGEYIATVPEFPGLSAFGDTREEAIKEAEIALEGFIDIFKKDGCKLPAPQVLNSFSGQTRLRLPKTLHANLTQQARREGVSLNTYLIQLLSENHVKNQIKEPLKNIEQSLQRLEYNKHKNDSFCNDIFTRMDWQQKENNNKLTVH